MMNLDVLVLFAFILSLLKRNKPTAYNSSPIDLNASYNIIAIN